MRLKREDIQAYKNKILLSVDEHPEDLIRFSVENLGLSINTVTKYVNELIESGELIRIGKSKTTKYILSVQKKEFHYLRKDIKGEESVLTKDVEPFLQPLNQSLSELLDYSFLEILNNALEHSEAEHIDIIVSKTLTKIEIIINDDGIGIFERIKETLDLDDKSQALIELAKGKFTSNPESHSGEGIFFSSKMCDSFYILSDGLCFSGMDSPVDKNLQQIPEGTSVILKLNKNTKKTAEEIYKEYAGISYEEPKFKTTVPLKIMLQEGNGTTLTSRSQARRLVSRFDRFDVVELDFDGVSFAGQAFLDEIFRVYKAKNTKTEIEVKNAGPMIANTIKHVLAASN